MTEQRREDTDATGSPTPSPLHERLRAGRPDPPTDDPDDPRNIAAQAAFNSDALVVEALRHEWLVKRGFSLQSCRCVRCASGGS